MHLKVNAGDMMVFRSWDAHRSTPVVSKRYPTNIHHKHTLTISRDDFQSIACVLQLQGERHILVIEFWQGPETAASSTHGRPADLPGGRGALCGPAVAADPASAALLWDCSKTASDDAAQLLDHAARLVARSAFLWEMAAAAATIPLLAQVRGPQNDCLLSKNIDFM